MIIIAATAVRYNLVIEIKEPLIEEANDRCINNDAPHQIQNNDDDDGQQ